MNDLTVVIPAKDESANIAAVLDGLGHVGKVIVVSADYEHTKPIVDRYPNAYFHLWLTPGKGEAMRAGLNRAATKYVMCMDADGSHDPEELKWAWDAFNNGASVVKGSRALGGSSDLTSLRRLGNAFLTGVYNLIYRQNLTDLCYGYIGATKQVLDNLDLDAVGFEIEAEFMARSAKAGYEIKEFPSFEYDRLHGKSNLYPIRDGFRILYTIVRNRWT
jgi:glycosyltransferase involved in cell wall biosynthesis